MSTLLRFIGIIILLAAVVVAILNLKRTYDLGLPWLAPLLIVAGALCVALSRRSGR